jgi:hypothetical protein
MQELPARDTQFAGFAALVVEDLRLHGGFPMRPVNRSEVRPLIERIIARRAYDLVIHTLSHECDNNIEHCPIEEIPDLTRWPDEVHDGTN